MSVPILLPLIIILDLTAFRELDAAVRRDALEESEEQSNDEAVTPAIVRQPDFPAQQASILNILRDSGLFRLTDALQATSRPTVDLLITSSDLDQLNSLLLEHPDLLTKLRSLIQQQPNLLDTLIEALNKANEKQSNEVPEHQRVRRDVNTSEDVVHMNQSSPHQQPLENEKQYEPVESDQRNLTATRVQSSSDHQNRDEESQSSFEEEVELEIFTNDTSPVQMETIIDQLVEIRDMCIEVLESSTSPEVILSDKLDYVREICRAFLQEFADNMAPIEVQRL